MNHMPRVTPPANTSTNQNGAEVSDHLDAVALCTPEGVATMYQSNGTTDVGVTHRMIGDRCRTCRCPAPICDGIASREGQPCCDSCDHVSVPVGRPVLRLIQGGAA